MKITTTITTKNGIFILKTMESIHERRAQDNHSRPGQRRQNDDTVSVPDERSGSHVAHDRLQRGRGRLEEHSLSHVGHWRSRVA